jgi:predicted DNA-binding protein YlxM (UPF0122 family)
MKQIKIQEEILKNLYLKKKLSMAKIAKKFRCDPGTVRSAMHQYGIKSRTLSEAAEKIIIPKQILKKLYYQNGLPTEQIGKQYGCSHATILNKMKLLRLRRRSRLGTRKPIFISKRELKSLYLRKKLSQNQIAKRNKCSICAIQKLLKRYRIKSRTLSEAQMKYPKYDFSENLIEKAYLIGFRLGDLSVTPAKLQIQASCSTSVPAQTKLIKSLFNKYTKVNINRKRFIKGQLITDIRCLLNKSFDFLLPKQDKIEPWILAEKKLFFAFLAGYVDAEGHIFVRLQQKSKTPIAGFQVQSYDKGILNQTWLKLNKLKIQCPRPRISKPKGYISQNGYANKKAMWRLTVNRKAALFLLINSIEPYVKHNKRKKAIRRAKINLIHRLKNKTRRLRPDFDA